MSGAARAAERLGGGHRAHVDRFMEDAHGLIIDEQDQPPSRQVDDHGRVSGTHTLGPLAAVWQGCSV